MSQEIYVGRQLRFHILISYVSKMRNPKTTTDIFYRGLFNTHIYYVKVIYCFGKLTKNYVDLCELTTLYHNCSYCICPYVVDIIGRKLKILFTIRNCRILFHHWLTIKCESIFCVWFLTAQKRRQQLLSAVYIYSYKLKDSLNKSYCNFFSRQKIFL